MNKNNLIPLIVLPLFILLWVWDMTPPSDLQGKRVDSVNGLWDMRSVNFDSYYVKMHGDVESVPNQLLTPEEFAASTDIIVGAIPNDIQYLTCRIRVKTTDDRLYSISRFTPGYGCRVYVNGLWLADFGQPGATKEENLPGERYMRLYQKSFADCEVFLSCCV